MSFMYELIAKEKIKKQGLLRDCKSLNKIVENIIFLEIIKNSHKFKITSYIYYRGDFCDLYKIRRRYGQVYVQ